MTARSRTLALIGEWQVEIRTVAIADRPSGLRLAAGLHGRPVQDWYWPIKAASCHGALLEQRYGWRRGELLFDI